MRGGWLKTLRKRLNLHANVCLADKAVKETEAEKCLPPIICYYVSMFCDTAGAVYSVTN